MSSRSLACSVYKTERRSRRTYAGGRPASSAEGRLGAVLKTPGILAALICRVSNAVVLLSGVHQTGEP